MTPNQIELIKARELERSNRAKEELEKAKIGANTAGSIFKGLGTKMIERSIKGGF